MVWYALYYKRSIKITAFAYIFVVNTECNIYNSIITLRFYIVTSCYILL